MSIARPDTADQVPESNQGRLEIKPILGFSDEDKIRTYQAHDDALRVTLRIGGYDVKRVLGDQGCKAEIMYPNLLKPEDIVNYDSPLVGFDGKTVIPKGLIRLSIQTRSKVVEVSFTLLS